jgi:hypothetical protein
LVPGIPAYSIKVHAKFPGQDPAIRGVRVLHDLTTGPVIALIESVGGELRSPHEPRDLRLTDTLKFLI